MSRSDQFIGLTKNGSIFKDMLERAGFIESSYAICESAFDPYPVEGSVYRLGPLIFREVLQMDPWSSGPMYFTCWQKENDKGKSVRQLYRWIYNPELKTEFDCETGTYNL